MPHEIDHFRRRFFGTAAMTLAAGRLGLLDTAHAHPGRTVRARRVTDAHVIRSAEAGGCRRAERWLRGRGSASWSPVILLHGWPYDIHTYVDVAPLLAAKGYRVIVPHLRGYGSTRFLSPRTARNGQQSVIAVDVIALMDALEIDNAIVAGCDWGARTANIVAALWPSAARPWSR